MGMAGTDGAGRAGPVTVVVVVETGVGGRDSFLVENRAAVAAAPAAAPPAAMIAKVSFDMVVAWFEAGKEKLRGKDRRQLYDE